MSHTENSQIFGAAVQNEATWAMLYPRCVIVSQWSFQRCRKGNEASLSV